MKMQMQRQEKTNACATLLCIHSLSFHSHFDTFTFDKWNIFANYVHSRLGKHFKMYIQQKKITNYMITLSFIFGKKNLIWKTFDKNILEKCSTKKKGGIIVINF